MKLWLNGAVMDAEAARIDPADRGFLLADGLIETLLVRAGRPVDWAAHLARLEKSAAALGLPFADPGLEEAIGLLAKANGLGARQAALRITLTRGPGPRGLLPPEKPRPTLMMTIGEAALLPGDATAITARARRPEQSLSALHKTLAYVDNIAAKREAASKGAFEGLMKNGAGAVVCASAANIVAIVGDRIVTPPVEDGALPGTALDRLCALAGETGLHIVRGTLMPEDLARADAILLTNSLIGVLPLAKLDGRGLPGHPDADRLKALYATWLERNYPLP